MAILLTGSDAYAQLITVLIIFVVVLAVTAYTTKWIANYQKKQGIGQNIDVIETARLGSNKWIQIVRIGEAYKVLAICKDTVTMLGDIPKEQLILKDGESQSFSFKEFLEKAVKKDSSESGSHKDKDV